MPLIERRTSTREPLALRLTLADGSRARTRNICPRGLYVVLPPATLVDDWVSVEVTLSPVQLRFRAYGEVLRVERTECGIGVALRLHAGRLHSVR